MASLHIDKEFNDLLNQLKTRLGLDKKQIVQKSIYYIFKNKINPENIKESDPTAELKELRKVFVGFMKTQDKEKLEPISQKLDYLIEKLNKIGSPSLNTSSQNPTTEQFQNLLSSYKSLAENHSKLGQHYNNSILSISKNQNILIEEVKKLNVTVENKLSKKLL